MATSLDDPMGRAFSYAVMALGAVMALASVCGSVAVAVWTLPTMIRDMPSVGYTVMAYGPGTFLPGLTAILGLYIVLEGRALAPRPKRRTGDEP